MPRWLNILIQFLAVGAQVAAPYIVDPHSTMVFHSVLGGIQAGTAVLAHNFNPDGSPAVVPYRP